jgi:anti-sigma regulatory factor (Ser/Thr protein kinase)
MRYEECWDKVKILPGGGEVANAASEGPADHYVHSALIYRSDEHLVSEVVPFLQEGIAAGEAVVAAFEDRVSGLVSDALGPVEGILQVTEPLGRSSPATALRSFRELFDGLLADGAPRLRLAGHVPHPGTGLPWDPWFRFEACVNDALHDVPGLGICCYDERTTPDPVLDDVRRTHPFLASGGTFGPCADFGPVDELVHSRPSTEDPLEALAPAVELEDPTAREARVAVAALGASTTIPSTELHDLVVAVSEVVTNAALHGAPPVEVRAWSAADRVVVTVTDCGPGPADPFSGLRPVRATGPGGFGLWLVEQLCAQVGYSRTGAGFTIRLIAGRPVVH